MVGHPSSRASGSWRVHLSIRPSVFSPARQRVRDWIHDFFSSLARLCDDGNDNVAAAAYVAIGATLRRHPLCVTAVDEDLRSFWGFEERPGRRVRGRDSAFAEASHKQVPMRYLKVDHDSSTPVPGIFVAFPMEA